MAADLHESVCKSKKWACKTYPHITEENDNGEADQYSKIMALQVMYETGSAVLENYLQKAESADYPYLKRTAAEIRSKL